MTGLTAIGALAVLDPVRAIDSLRRSCQRGAYLGRANWLPELMTQDPEAAAARIQEQLRGNSEDWQVLNAFQGYEHWLSPQLVDALLDDLQSLLDKQLAAGTQHDFGALIIRLNMLSDVWRPGLLKRFSGRRGTELEDKLITWLIRLGHRATAMEDRHGRVEALDVVRKVSPAGFARVVQHYLISESEHTRRDGIEIGSRCPTPDVVERLGCIATSDHLMDVGGRSLPVLQAEAMEALAIAGGWRELIRSPAPMGTIRFSRGSGLSV